MNHLKHSLLFVATALTAFAFACGDDKTLVAVAPGGTDAGSSSGRPGDDDDFAPPPGDDDAGNTANECTAAAKSLLHPQTAVSEGVVKVIGTTDGVTKIWVDASAGGPGPGVTSAPRVYLKMDGTKVEISDVDAAKSTGWDLAFKRVEIFTNGGDGGPGKGAGLVVDKKFDDVTSADATGVAQEKFFKGDCEAQTDPGGQVLTTFDGWYDYDESTHIPFPFVDRAIVMKSADGTLYKVGILSYQGKDDGSTTGGQTGQYVFQVKKL